MYIDFHTHGKLAKKLPFSEEYTHWLFSEAQGAGLVYQTVGGVGVDEAGLQFVDAVSVIFQVSSHLCGQIFSLAFILFSVRQTNDGLAILPGHVKVGLAIYLVIIITDQLPTFPSADGPTLARANAIQPLDNEVLLFHYADEAVYPLIEIFAEFLIMGKTAVQSAFRYIVIFFFQQHPPSAIAPSSPKSRFQVLSEVRVTPIRSLDIIMTTSIPIYADVSWLSRHLL